MKPSFIVLLSDNITASIAFWRDVMGLKLTYSDETIGYAAFDMDIAGLSLSLYTRNGLATLLGPAATLTVGREMYLCFPVENVDAAYVDLTGRGAVALVAPRDVPAQQSRLAHISSPDGHIIELFGPISTAPDKQA